MNTQTNVTRNGFGEVKVFPDENLNYNVRVSLAGKSFIQGGFRNPDEARHHADHGRSAETMSMEKATKQPARPVKVRAPSRTLQCAERTNRSGGISFRIASSFTETSAPQAQ